MPRRTVPSPFLIRKEENMWKRYVVELHIPRHCGGIPRNPELVRRWQEATGGTPEQADVIAENLGDQATAAVEGLWTGYLSDDAGLYIEARQVKAMLKESANIVKAFFTNAKGKVPPLRSQLAERVFVAPERIHLGRAEPDGTTEKPIHVLTRQGPRTALKRVDYVTDVKIAFTLNVLDDGVITERHLHAIFEHAQLNGLGTDRSQGAGMFTLERFEEDGCRPVE